MILKAAEKKAKEGGAKLLQCTIRKDNIKSIKLFSKNGYINVNKFYNPISGNYVFVYQKIISNDEAKGANKSLVI